MRGEPDHGRPALREDGFAFRVKYLVAWGKRSHTGRNAQRAGIRKGDIE